MQKTEILTLTVRRELKSPDEFSIQKGSVTGIMSRSIRDARPDEEYTGGNKYALGLYFKGFPPEAAIGVDTSSQAGDGHILALYENPMLGITGNIDFSPRYPVHLRFSVLIALHTGIDAGPGEKHDDGFGFEIMTSAGFTLFETGRIKFWTGPQLGFMHRKLEWDDGFEIEFVGIYTGALFGFDYYITDSVMLTADMGFRFTYGEIIIKDSENPDLRGYGVHLGLGAMYRF